jgi:TnpA family transposase
MYQKKVFVFLACRACPTPMPRRQLLSPQARSSLFDPPRDPALVVRFHALSPADLALVRRRRRPANRLGFAIQLAYLRHPGRAIEAGEAPPEAMLAFIAQQLGVPPTTFLDYARRDPTRREHLLELRDRTFENQSFRASGLNLVAAAIILWNAIYLARAADALRSRGEIVPDELLAHVAPLGCEHVGLTGDCSWADTLPGRDDFRPLRDSRSALLKLAA